MRHRAHDTDTLPVHPAVAAGAPVVDQPYGARHGVPDLDDHDVTDPARHDRLAVTADRLTAMLSLLSPDERERLVAFLHPGGGTKAGNGGGSQRDQDLERYLAANPNKNIYDAIRERGEHRTGSEYFKLRVGGLVVSALAGTNLGDRLHISRESTIREALVDAALSGLVAAPGHVKRHAKRAVGAARAASGRLGDAVRWLRPVQTGHPHGMLDGSYAQDPEDAAGAGRHALREEPAQGVDGPRAGVGPTQSAARARTRGARDPRSRFEGSDDAAQREPDGGDERSVDALRDLFAGQDDEYDNAGNGGGDLGVVAAPVLYAPRMGPDGRMLYLNSEEQRLPAPVAASTLYGSNRTHLEVHDEEEADTASAAPAAPRARRGRHAAEDDDEPVVPVAPQPAAVAPAAAVQAPAQVPEVARPVRPTVTRYGRRARPGRVLAQGVRAVTGVLHHGRQIARRATEVRRGGHTTVYRNGTMRIV